jgi:hypothetical protein
VSNPSRIFSDCLMFHPGSCTAFVFLYRATDTFESRLSIMRQVSWSTSRIGSRTPLAGDQLSDLPSISGRVSVARFELVTVLCSGLETVYAFKFAFFMVYNTLTLYIRIVIVCTICFGRQ